VVDNGTFINSYLLPVIGYQEGKELTEDRVRKKHGLEPRARMRDLDDPAGRQTNYICQLRRLDRVRRDALPPHPTKLRSRPATCSANGPRTAGAYFHYRMDVPILKTSIRSSRRATQ